MEQKSTEAIIVKIRKMMALANDAGASDGERDNAMRMAYNIMAKHNLAESDLTEKELRQLIGLGGDAAPYARRIANALAGMFFCNYYTERRGATSTHKFVGKAANVMTASLMADYVIKSIRKEARKTASVNGYTNTWKTSFYKGAASVIVARCIEMIEAQKTETTKTTGTGLVLASVYDSEKLANDQFLAEAGVRLRMKASREHRATAAGYNAGKEFGGKVNLNRQVGGTTGQLRLGS